jgi:hypothetical protein
MSFLFISRQWGYCRPELQWQETGGGCFVFFIPYRTAASWPVSAVQSRPGFFCSGGCLSWTQNSDITNNNYKRLKLIMFHYSRGVCILLRMLSNHKRVLSCDFIMFQISWLSDMDKQPINGSENSRIVCNFEFPQQLLWRLPSSGLTPCSLVQSYKYLKKKSCCLHLQGRRIWGWKL